MNLQLFDLDHFGRRRLAMLRDILSQHNPEVDLHALAAENNITPSWNDAIEGDSTSAFLNALQVLKKERDLSLSLQIGDRAQITDSGLLGYAVLTAPTVLQAAKVTSHALNTSNYLVRTKLSSNETHSRTVFNIVSQAQQYRSELLEMSVLAVWRCTQSILPLGRASTPSYVTFAFPEPKQADLYRTLFGCPVEFDQAHTVLAMPIEWLHAEIPSGNSELINHCANELKQVLGEGYIGNSIIARVKRALLEHPNVCKFSLEGTAQQLVIHPRRLRRNLESAGTGFRKVCTEVRMELAQQYLQATDLPLKAIAYQLGYAHPNNFTRAYREHFGIAPQGTRKI